MCESNWDSVIELTSVYVHVCVRGACESIIIRAANANELALWREPPGEGPTPANSLADLRSAWLEFFWWKFQGFSLKKKEEEEKNLKILWSEINIALVFFGGVWVIAVDGESGRSFTKKTSKSPLKSAGWDWFAVFIGDKMYKYV